MKMISCKKRLPDHADDKLVYGVRYCDYFGTETFYQVAYYNGDAWCVSDNLGAEHADFVDDVTHWCELPTEMDCE